MRAAEVTELRGTSEGRGPSRRAATETAECTEDVVEVETCAATTGGETNISAVSTSESAEDIFEVHAGCSAATGTSAETAGAHRANRIVLLALLRIGQDRVGLANFLEAFFSFGVPLVLVGVPGARKFAVGLLDRGLISILAYAKDLVEILLEPIFSTHCASPPFFDSAVR